LEKHLGCISATGFFSKISFCFRNTLKQHLAKVGEIDAFVEILKISFYDPLDLPICSHRVEE